MMAGPNLQAIKDGVAAFLDYHKHDLTAEAGLAYNRTTKAALSIDMVKAGDPEWIDHVKEIIQADPSVPKKRGRKPNAHWLRDTYIAEAVSLAVKGGIAATKNSTTAGHSACSIVAEALGKVRVNMTEDNVRKIWVKHGPSIGLREAPIVGN